MRNCIALLLLFSACTHAYSQELKVDLSYKYLFSNQWDKAIQTYNFSRPFIAEKQPLLIHGSNASLSFIFNSSKKIRNGINISYSYFRSLAENENFKNILNLHFLNLGYILHFENKVKLKGLYSDLLIAATTCGLFRDLNGESFEYNEAGSNALGIGGDLNLKIGYSLHRENRYSLSPFISFAYTPYLYSPNSESILNQTKGLTSKNWTGILTTQIGLSLHLQAKKNN